MKGYFTIEATLIFPIVFFVYVFLLYIGMFQYDRCMMEQDIRRIALRGSTMTDLKSNEIISNVQEMLNGNEWNKYMIIEEKDVETIVEWGSVNIIMKSAMHVPFLNRVWERIEGAWTILVRGNCETVDGKLFLRTSKRLLGGRADAENGTDNGPEP